MEKKDSRNRTYPVELKSCRRLGDNGGSLTVHTSVEITSDDIKYFDEMRGNQCFLAVSDITVGLEMPEIDIDKLKAGMVENTVYNKNISPSERRRRKIWVLHSKILKRDPTKEEHEKFYMDYMNTEDDRLSEKIASYE